MLGEQGERNAFAKEGRDASGRQAVTGKTQRRRKGWEIKENKPTSLSQTPDGRGRPLKKGERIRALSITQIT